MVRSSAQSQQTRISTQRKTKNRGISVKLLLQTAALALVLALTLALFNPLRATLSKSLAKPLATPTFRTMSAASTNSPALKVTKRPWDARGHADHGWLYTFHTFSFASYHEPGFGSYGPLRVINEDRVARGTGFGKHAHAEFLIFSYIVAGELEHEDSMGNLETLRRGEVQFTSAGTGIRHSEHNRNGREDAHFLQIWARPHTPGLAPSYKTRGWSDADKADRLVRIMEAVGRHDGAEDRTSPIPLHADLSMDAAILSPGRSVTHQLVADGERKVYVHLVMAGKTQPEHGGARIRIGGVVLGEGDGAFIDGAAALGKVEIESVGDVAAEFVLFDLGPEDA